MTKPIIATLLELYGKDKVASQRVRYENAVKSYEAHFGIFPKEEHYRIFSAPGRTEIGGNHTDHNNGKVLAASIDLDIIAVVVPIDIPKAVVKSEGYEESSIDLNALDIDPAEKNTPEALIRGVAKGFIKNGFAVGGFKAYTTSNVLSGSGLSSSAAFEVLIGTIFSYLYNKGKIDPIKVAQIAKFSENEYFGKPCGLMDQMACSYGGFVAIDFKDNEIPIIEKVSVDFNRFEHALCIIDTKGDHTDLTNEYAAIPNEMKAVAQHFSVPTLRNICKQDIILNIDILRAKLGDRAVLRALHFFDENQRVDRLVYALRNGDFPAFLDSVNESGNSSYKYLQNIYSCSDVRNQSIGIALNVAESSLKRKGACRVHGGGFAGTIEAFVPLDLLKEFKLNMERVFGADSCHLLRVRPYGGCEINEIYAPAESKNPA